MIHSDIQFFLYNVYFVFCVSSVKVLCFYLLVCGFFLGTIPFWFFLYSFLSVWMAMKPNNSLIGTTVEFVMIKFD